MKKKIIIGIGTALLILSSLIGYVSWTSRNTAQAEAGAVLTDFANSTNSFLWCENGAGKGIDNDTPWWEQIYLGDTNFNDTASIVEDYLLNRGYSIDSTFIQNSDDGYNLGKTYWELTGNKDRFTVLARISNKETTLNNCFGGEYTHMGVNVSPESYESVIVIQFREPR